MKAAAATAALQLPLLCSLLRAARSLHSVVRITAWFASLPRSQNSDDFCSPAGRFFFVYEAVAVGSLARCYGVYADLYVPSGFQPASYQPSQS